MWPNASHDFLWAVVNYWELGSPVMPATSRLSPEQASSILREVPPEKAFFFYRAVGSPLYVSARSLKEFVERIATVEPASLAFHSERRDFESWISMLGDGELSKKLAGLRTARLRDESLRMRLYDTTRSRLEQLSELEA